MTLSERGALIRDARKIKNFSTEQMADFMNMSDGTYKKIESGEKDPTTQEAKKLMEILDLDPSLFYTKNIIINGDNSPGVGYGNIVSIDKEYMDLLKLSIENTHSTVKYYQNSESSLHSMVSKLDELTSHMNHLVEKIVSK